MVSVEADVLGGPPDNPEPLLGPSKGTSKITLLCRVDWRTAPGLSLVEPPPHGWRGFGDR